MIVSASPNKQIFVSSAHEVGHIPDTHIRLNMK